MALVLWTRKLLVKLKSLEMYVVNNLVGGMIKSTIYHIKKNLKIY